MLRATLSLAVVFLALLGLPSAARAEEVFVLDNGVVLRGTALKEAAGGVVVRLSGFPEEARVTIETLRIVKRYSTTPARPGPQPDARPAFRATDLPVAAVGPQVPTGHRLWAPTPVTMLEPAEEPSLKHEGFFERLGRVMLLAMPRDLGSRVLLGGLGLIVLWVLLALGGRLLEIEGLGWGRGILLSLALGLVIVADVVHSNVLLRADRASWVLPGEALAWLALAWALLRCSPGKAVVLLAFMLFSASVVLFTAGAVLVSY